MTPFFLLTKEHLDRCLQQERITAIRKALLHPGSKAGEISVDYLAPWLDSSTIEPASIDLVISHSVMQHVKNLEDGYMCKHTGSDTH